MKLANTMDLSNLHLPEGLKTFVLICDNNTVNIGKTDHSHKSCSHKEDNVDSHHKEAKNTGIVVTDKQKENEILSLLDKLMEGKTKKDAAIIIQAALLAGVILKPTYSQFCSRYGNKVIGKTMYGRYVGTDKYILLKTDMESIIMDFNKIKC